MSRPFLPNSTQIPNVVLDYWMADLSGAEFKVLMYIARRTYGFGKASDRISLTQISEGIKKRDGSILDQGTGLSRASVIRAIQVLISKGLLIKDHDWRSGTSCPTESTFSLNILAESPQVVSPDSAPSSAPTESESCDGPKHNVQELIDSLVEQGLNKFDAIRLSDSNPEECARQLKYLPFVRSFKTSKGAYLRTAIEREFGAPAGFSEHTSPKQEPKKASSAKRQKVPNFAALKVSIESHNESARESFLRYLNEKRVSVTKSRLASHSSGMRERLIECMNSEDYILSQFEDWAGTAEGKALIVEHIKSLRCASEKRSEATDSGSIN